MNRKIPRNFGRGAGFKGLMAMNASITIGIAALLLGGAGGFLVGKSGSSRDGEASTGAAQPDARLRRTAGSTGQREPSESRTRVRSVDEALREPGQLARMQSLIDLYANMSPDELMAAAEGLENLPMGDRIMASILLFSRWAEVDPQGALAYSNTMGMGGMFAKPTILRSWASVDPVNAAKYFSENPSDFAMMGGGRGPGGGDNAAALIAREWAKLDPDAALAWANTLSGDDKSQALVSVVGEMASSDPSRAAAMAAGLEGDDQTRAYGEIAERWAATDFSAAESWINTLSGEARDRAMSEALGVLARTDPQGAANRVSSLPEGGGRDRAIRDIAGEWSESDPARAAAWLIGQQTGDMGDAMREVMGNWVSQDSAGALTFIQQQPAGDGRDAATQTYLWMNREMPPSDAVALAESISDEGDRSRALGMTAWRWMREDEAAARAYVESTTALSEEAKQRILNSDGGGGGPEGGPGRGRGRGR